MAERDSQSEESRARVGPVARVRRWLDWLEGCGKHDKSHRAVRVYCYVRRLIDAFAAHQCTLMAAACAYCALLSLVPFLVVGVAAVGYVVGGSDRALSEVLATIRTYAPHDSGFTNGIESVLQNVLRDRRLIGVIGMTGLVYAVHQAFLAMQPAMNLIWSVPESRSWLKQRAVAIGASFYTLLLLGGNLAATALVAYVSKDSIPLISSRIEAMALSALLSLLPMLFMTLLCALLYCYLPSRTVPWKAACLGAIVAAVLWQALLSAFGLYLSHAHGYDRLYGPLAGLVIVVVWAYYSMVILLIGAEVAADFEASSHGDAAADARAHSGANLAAATGRDPHRKEPLAETPDAVIPAPESPV